MVLSEKETEAETRADGDNRQTVGGTQVAEGGETQPRGGLTELGIKLASRQRQPGKEGVQRSLEFREIMSVWNRAAYTRTRQHK